MVSFRDEPFERSIDRRADKLGACSAPSGHLGEPLGEVPHPACAELQLASANAARGAPDPGSCPCRRPSCCRRPRSARRAAGVRHRRLPRPTSSRSCPASSRSRSLARPPLIDGPARLPLGGKHVGGGPLLITGLRPTAGGQMTADPVVEPHHPPSAAATSARRATPSPPATATGTCVGFHRDPPRPRGPNRRRGRDRKTGSLSSATVTRRRTTSSAPRCRDRRTHPGAGSATGSSWASREGFPWATETTTPPRWRASTCA